MKIPLNKEETRLVSDALREYRDINQELARRVEGDGDANVHDSAVDKVSMCSDVLRKLEAGDD
jgi:hypothetical protein